MKTFEDFEKVNYSAHFSKKGDTYFFHVNELSLTGKGKSVSSAFDNLLDKKRELFKDYEEADLIDKIPMPNGLAIVDSNKFWKDLIPFTAKSAIFCVLFVLSLNQVTNRINKKANKFLVKVAHKSERINEKFQSDKFKYPGRYLKKVLIKNMSTEKKEKLRGEIREIVHALRPFIKEIQPLFSQK